MRQEVCELISKHQNVMRVQTFRLTKFGITGKHLPWMSFWIRDLFQLLNHLTTHHNITNGTTELILVLVLPFCLYVFKILHTCCFCFSLIVINIDQDIRFLFYILSCQGFINVTNIWHITGFVHYWRAYVLLPC